MIERFGQGDRRALARVITWVENGRPEGLQAVDALYSRSGRARIIGVTGPPGTGKSTLVDKLVMHLREDGHRVGVVAVDPSSPFSGGAILGDRIRMGKLAGDEGIFIRSMGTRGALGGLARATLDVALMMDAFGFDVVVVETVGVGQSEVAIVKTADTSIVVEVPGLGDSIQAIKAGVLEIGDLFVVNKSDRDGAQRVILEIETMLKMNPDPPEWDPPIVPTVALRGEGTRDVIEAVASHWRHLAERDGFAGMRRRRREAAFRSHLTEGVGQYLMKRIEDDPAYAGLHADVLEGRVSPHGACQIVLDRLRRSFE